jgi:hypothetical protein
VLSADGSWAVVTDGHGVNRIVYNGESEWRNFNVSIYGALSGIDADLTLTVYLGGVPPIIDFSTV